MKEDTDDSFECANAGLYANTVFETIFWNVLF